MHGTPVRPEPASMATIAETLRADMVAAMRSGDARRRDTLRLLMAAVENGRIAAGHALEDPEVVGVLQREARQRRDSIAEYQKGNRPDLVAVEEAELAIIEAYLPATLSDDEVRTFARETVAEVGAEGPGDLGKVMSPLMKRLAGRADGRRANEIVREILSG
ncbi:MAG: GatB/YqeY domain-containing protein [Dehalococcoidia bacterium]|nr:GatB/YqeY domain-containing protein [Dehalococcoidia bacterium]